MIVRTYMCPTDPFRTTSFAHRIILIVPTSIMLSRHLLALFAYLPAALACPQESRLRKRDVDPESPKWSYEASYNWGQIDHSYATCRTGTQQSPIALSLYNGLCHSHKPTFANYTGNFTGTYKNWGYGPSFSLPSDDITVNPSLSWDDETAYLIGWHLHAPADHIIDSHRSQAEIHFVHASASGHEAAVLSFLLDSSTTPSPFFSQMPPFVSFNETAAEYEQKVSLDLEAALKEVGMAEEYWSYEGSLSSPPCAEGIRWFVARQRLGVSVGQMQAILGASTYSARAVQEVWLHRINE